MTLAIGGVDRRSFSLYTTMTMNRPTPFLTTPAAVLLGAVLISVSILIHGGIIKIGAKAGGKVAGVQTAPSAPPVPQQPTVTLSQVKDVFSKSQIKFGDANKKLVAIEAADPSCPFCHVAAGKNPQLNKQVGARFTLVSDGGSYVAPVPKLQELMEEGKASFAYIYTPGHGNGEMGTKALYCSHEKGRFWPTHDLLMTDKGYSLLNDQVKNDKAKSAQLAEFLSPAVDKAFIKECLESGRYDKRLQEDINLAQSLGITGTPGFYLNLTPFSGAYSYTDMEQAVKEALGS